MQLWRPVGLEELDLIFETGMREFPPRLVGQPIFYPVLNRSYAEKIARDWNSKEGSGAGYVTRFEVPDFLADRYERQVVGDSTCEEWWVPAEELVEFNASIQHPIIVEAAFFGEKFRGFIPGEFGLKGKDAKLQLVALAETLEYSSFDVWCETYTNRKAVFLNYLFWLSLSPSETGLQPERQSKVLEYIVKRWSTSDIPFPLPLASSNLKDT